ncbi:MAG: type-F conjugative transfer system pilin assembly protein TrbC [Alphaproteobacteria bacterium]|nr:MAG: type-F conjugative transfer system pilin assembly protein TrbC [Alphaproteobacteria bacterium]
MEETKLLRFLMLIIVSCTACITYGDEATQQWAQEIADRDRKIVMDNFKDMMQMQGFDSNLRDSVLKPRPVLQIFVSTSMPRQLLRAYAREASRYDGVLVFRGLPGGSFRKLTDLVLDISDKKHECAMQIDDEAFTGFDIKTVPSIVLSKPVSMFSEQTELSKFDKVHGSITIKAALEMFASRGDLASNARGILQ